jgi:NitT/TauT family transport system ATP-binding protein
VDEAVLLGDRVAVLGGAGRPLRALVDIPHPRKREFLGHAETRAARGEVLAALEQTDDAPTTNDPENR